MRTKILLQYAMLSIPLAFAGLPIYVHVPHFYATHYSVSLASLSAVLLIIRFIDAFQDPIIGIFSEKYAHYKQRIITISSLILISGFYGLFHVPPILNYYAALWMGMMLLLVYSSFSCIMINYYAASVTLGHSQSQQMRISSFRESFMLIGVMLAAILPQLLTNQFGELTGYHYFTLSFIPICIICVCIAIRTIPNSAATLAASYRFSDTIVLVKQRMIASLLWLFFINAIPTAITSTLFLFFVEDVLHANAQAGQMLMLYFLSAALSVPLWNVLSSRYNIYHVLISAMILAITSFIWAYGLQAGEVVAFYGICALSGAALGGDMVLLPALYANALDQASTQHNKELGNIGFSVWNFISKLNMSLAAGIALPVLAWLNYQPQDATSNIDALSFAYACIPCAFKVVACGYAWKLKQMTKI